jgi:hypothetical protein
VSKRKPQVPPPVQVEVDEATVDWKYLACTLIEDAKIDEDQCVVLKVVTEYGEQMTVRLTDADDECPESVYLRARLRRGELKRKTQVRVRLPAEWHTQSQVRARALWAEIMFPDQESARADLLSTLKLNEPDGVAANARIVNFWRMFASQHAGASPPEEPCDLTREVERMLDEGDRANAINLATVVLAAGPSWCTRQFLALVTELLARSEARRKWPAPKGVPRNWKEIGTEFDFLRKEGFTHEKAVAELGEMGKGSKNTIGRALKVYRAFMQDDDDDDGDPSV